MLRAKDAQALGITDALFEPADFLEKSVKFAADVVSGKIAIDRTDHTKDQSAWDAAIATGEAAIAKKYGKADIASPKKALALIKAAQTSSRGEGFDAEDTALTDLVMSDPLRASLYAFNLIQKKRKKVEGAPKAALARKVTKVCLLYTSDAADE